MNRRFSRLAKLLTISCAGLLVALAGCGSSQEKSEPATTRARQAPPARYPTASGGRGMMRELVGGDHRLKLFLAGQVLRVELEKPASARRPGGEIQADDSVTVVPAGADVRVETQVLARVLAGQVLSVTEVKGDFVGVSMLVKGKPVSGWLQRREVAFKVSEPKLEPTLAKLPPSKLVSAAMLMQKAKVFDDGLMAAVELAAQEGAGRFAGKRSMIAALVAAALKQAAGPEQAPIVLLAGAKLGGVAENFPAALGPKVSQAIATFRSDALRSLPISFYTWSSELTRIFQQDRMLQTPLGSGEARLLAGLLGHDKSARAAYQAVLDLHARLTNPAAEPDLLQPGGNYFFAPARSFEGDLLKHLFPSGAIPAKFNLADEMISQVKAGKLSLTPTVASGWYDYLAWSFEPLIVPEK
ncbi:MAG TPA: hypothetical protein VHY20_14730, partial [Pirellulales bacterium]|nr:hypothetical protein [Pirellulales bacterium]